MTRINSRLSGARKLRLIQSLLQDGIPFGEYKPCHVVIRAGLREFRLGQPNIENPLNSKTCKIFTTQLDKLVNNSQVGAVIVNSVSDEVFSSGMDSHDLKNLKDVNKFAHFIDKTSKVKPIVSVFDGIVANAGYGAFSGSTVRNLLLLSSLVASSAVSVQNRRRERQILAERPAGRKVPAWWWLRVEN